MFDYHMHSIVSFDGHDSGLQLVQAAKAAGLKEICFTDHLDYDPLGKMGVLAFDTARYNAEYDCLQMEGLKIRRGMEFGMTTDNRAQFKADLKRRPFDFVLGSVHFVDDLDVYFEEYWHDKTVFEAERRYLEATLDCVRLHDDFDVLAHLTYIGKTSSHHAPRPVPFAEHRELIDEILKTVAQKGKGLEMNTSGVDRCGGFLPTEDYFRRFKEYGGEIVTIGSDAHTASRVGQYSFEACEILKDIFGYVCTFEERKPIFHKL
ncbi:MAG: histidinol-phosphatase HisJ family protein [Oscillospiraceae bacterium]|nr:histidinol-phosphatase HisJ family protein [Oscillospiraceae bacterium]